MTEVSRARPAQEDRQILIAVDQSPRKDDALALGALFADVLSARSVVFTAAQGLHEAIENMRPLVAVVGSTHRGAVGRATIGSTAAQLLQGASCAIAVAPAGFAKERTRRLLRIGVAFDGGRESVWALHAGASIAERLHAKLTIAVVRQPVHAAYYSQPGVAAPLPDTTDAAASVFVLRRAEAVIPKEMPFERRMLDGPPAEALLAASRNFDLIVLGSRGHGLAMRTLLGSVSKKVVEHAHCPVLVIPRHAGPDPLRLPQFNDRVAVVV